MKDLTEFKQFKKSHGKEKEGTATIAMDDGVDGEYFECGWW